MKTALSSALGVMLALGLVRGSIGSTIAQAQAPLRVIAFGAHPDDAEQKAGGVAALWSARGAKVKLVSMTNGDVGHFAMAGGPLATRRKAEVQECAKIFGTEVGVLDIHDGELVPSLENRKLVAREIRNWQADIVMGHRPYDYHPDHRYTGVLMEDTAVVVVAPFFTPDAPAVKRNPIYLFYSDDFKTPAPFDPTIVVSIDAVAEKKWACVAAMPSQFGDADSWQARTRPDVPTGDAERRAFLVNMVKDRNAAIADKYRAQLIALYGEQRGKQVKYAEAFQLCQYGRQPTLDELKRLFPITSN
jgi:N-acetylglucosamine malate deacetylase 1